MKVSNNYSVFSKYYDQIMSGFSEKFNKRFNLLSKKFDFNLNSVLELACGTGNNLMFFNSDKTKIKYGLDISKDMIDIAKSKLSDTTLLVQDMTTFKIDKKFTLIFCFFDSINHLLDYNLWLKVFKNVRNHLSNDAYFIFDINTTLELNKSNTFTSVRNFNDKDIFIMRNSNIGKNTAKWELSFFVHDYSNNYKRYEECIYERTFEISRIKYDLNKFFSNVLVYNTIIEPYDENDSIAIFVCRK
ncbi:MAG: hypothetical protein CR982_01135 [Candidatus Cloacimonadota bacterium]|nr:MAG: hypothetical protein CR982_01135 [Candidatus Cloacimonadota bacterium]